MKQLIYNTMVGLNYFKNIRRERLKLYSPENIGILTGEFYNKELGGFGGYGKTVKNLADYYNKENRMFNIKVILSEKFGYSEPIKDNCHDTDVILPGNSKKNYLLNFYKYQELLNKEQIRLLIIIDYYSSYQKILEACPHIPILIWIRDPRGIDELEKLATVEEEFSESRHKDRLSYLTQAKEREDALKEILKLSRTLKRKVIFASNAIFLTDRARSMFKLPQLEPYMLHNPVPVPAQRNIHFSDRPSVCFIGRNAAVKRIWIVFKLAERHPNIDFFIAGVTKEEIEKNPKFSSYASLANIKFLGMIDDQKKFELLHHCWGLINTSVHEGYPVTFQEAFAFGKCVISCQNPEGLTERFGFYTGEILGSGTDKESLDKFSHCLEQCIKNPQRLYELGVLAQNFFETHHSFERFNHDLQTILNREGLI
jgi:hypothetical protein